MPVGLALPAPDRMPMITASQLTKQYGTVVALQGLDLAVEPGTIYALLGPNGAGKTTTISILTTLIQPTSGAAQVGGFDVLRDAARVRAMIGVTFQDLVLDQDLTGRQVLDIHGQLYRMPTTQRRSRMNELVNMVSLTDAIDRRVKTYSGGMKRRLELARGLMTNPAVLFLDEPTQGLDPQNRSSIWEYVRHLKQQQGLTLLLTTHAMEEAEALADRVGIIDHGQMVVEGTPAALVAELGSDMIRISGHGEYEHYAAQIGQLVGVQHVQCDAADQIVTIGVDNGARRVAEIIGVAAGAAFQINEVTITRPGLGDVFLAHTGRALRD